MYPRTNFEMTDEELKILLEACRTVPMMMIGGFAPRSQQQNSNDAWKRLGEKMGFDWSTVRPIHGKGIKHFSAVPLETNEQKTKRENEEARKKNLSRLLQIESDVEKLITEKNEIIKQLEENE